METSKQVLIKQKLVMMKDVQSFQEAMMTVKCLVFSQIYTSMPYIDNNNIYSGHFSNEIQSLDTINAFYVDVYYLICFFRGGNLYMQIVSNKYSHYHVYNFEHNFAYWLEFS